jgi:release factor glutamine methyltransferase
LPVEAAEVDNGVEVPGPGGELRPSLAPDQEEWIRACHEEDCARLRRRTDLAVTCLGRQLVVPGEVFPPAPLGELLSRAVLEEVRAGDRVLDMGTGSGINAILAASVAGPETDPQDPGPPPAPVSVVGVDINPLAVACARGNAARNGVAASTSFRVSDVFDRVRGRFDLIVFDPALCWFPPRDALEAAITDAGYRALTRFMTQARDFLRPGGRILVSFGTPADLDYLHTVTDRFGLARDQVAERELERHGRTARYVTYRLEPVGAGVGHLDVTE